LELSARRGGSLEEGLPLIVWLFVSDESLMSNSLASTVRAYPRCKTISLNWISLMQDLIRPLSVPDTVGRLDHCIPVAHAGYVASCMPFRLRLNELAL